SGDVLMRHPRGALAAVLILGASPACADFAPLASNTCGNAVVDASEDCDTFASEPGTQCGDPASTNACRFVCGDTGGGAPTCPRGWGCGRDGVCRRPSGQFAPLGDIVPFASPHTLRSGDFDADGVPDVLLLGEEDGLGRTPARIVYAPTASTPAT